MTPIIGASPFQNLKKNLISIFKEIPRSILLNVPFFPPPGPGISMIHSWPQRSVAAAWSVHFDCTLQRAASVSVSWRRDGERCGRISPLSSETVRIVRGSNNSDSGDHTRRPCTWPGSRSAGNEIRSSCSSLDSARESLHRCWRLRERRWLRAAEIIGRVCNWKSKNYYCNWNKGDFSFSSAEKHWRKVFNQCVFWFSLSDIRQFLSRDHLQNYAFKIAL